MVQEPATKICTPFLTKDFTTQKHCLEYTDPKMFCRQGHSAGLQCPVPNPNAPKGSSQYPKSIVLQFQTCYHSHLNISQKTKTNTNFRGQAWVRPRVKCWVKGFILSQSIMPQISNEDSGVLQLTKNAKTNNMFRAIIQSVAV